MSAADWRANSWTWISISPVARRAFAVSAERATTLPVTVTTLSGRACSIDAKIGLDVSTTHWVTP